tara:strand:- start:98 stop:526 length:429 start_codon:yes stop_codon:yes gene_type:complete
MSNILVDQLTGKTTDTTIDVFAGHAADSTTRTNLEQGLCKAFINMDGTTTGPTTRDSFNVGSVTDKAANDFALNFTNDFNNNDYTFCGSASSSGNSTAWVSGPPSMTESEFATDSLNIFTSYQNSLGAEYTYTTCNVFGDLA